MSQTLTKTFFFFVLVFLSFLYIHMFYTWNENTEMKYVVHSGDMTFYCENIQRTELDLYGYHCNGKYPVVEFRSPHIIVHRGE